MNKPSITLQTDHSVFLSNIINGALVTNKYDEIGLISLNTMILVKFWILRKSMNYKSL